MLILVKLLHAFTKGVIKLCREGSNVRFFFRYHPLHALNNWRTVHGRRPTVDISNVEVKIFKASYVYEMICVLVPRFRDWDIMHSLFHEVDFMIGKWEYPTGFPQEKKTWCSCKRTINKLSTHHVGKK